MSSAVATETLVKSGFMSSVGSATKTVAIGIKDAAVWCGHVIKVFFTGYVFPACKAVWPVFKTCMKSLGQFLKTAPGLGTFTFLAAAGAGITLLMVANSDCMAEDKNELERFMLRVAAVVCFIFSGAALAVGITLAIV
ncbi:MAG: hypothetical protein H7A37_09725 [Chlamydiales bacterium]|nr:hypothetical protein [Chlamydiia bacterium]MCP5508555.1 hypothetical protein [Chlamydiales bacterium]